MPGSPLAWVSRIPKRRVAVAAVAVGFAYMAITFMQVLVISGHQDTGAVDAIVVLGAAQYNGEPSPVLAARLDHAEELWSDDVAALIVTTGSNQPGDTFTEGFAGFEYLRFAGVPEASIIVITDGASTWEQLAATARVLRDRELSTVVLVSDPYHGLRLRQIATEVGLEANISSTDGSSSIRQLARETAAVGLGRILGYRRVDNWLGGVG